CKFPTWKEFIETLAHEMVHLYQMAWLKDPYSNHNANFFAWKNKFKLAGLNLSRC
ncbi:MAG TPA: SprT-like family protein, partial [Maribacter sp.]|nr:SprT-like family protein [Maribacter sp.]